MWRDWNDWDDYDFRLDPPDPPGDTGHGVLKQLAVETDFPSKSNGKENNLIKEITKGGSNMVHKSMPADEDQPVYIIGNPFHYLGFMVIGDDDPLGYKNPAEALVELGLARSKAGNHLKLFQAVPVMGPVTDKQAVERHNQDSWNDDFDFSLVSEYLK